MIADKARQRRRGATAVETALVLIPVILFFYGIFEYGRFLMDRNLLNNAAREGCRYALANNTNTSVTANVKSMVTGYMAGRDAASFTNFSVTVSGTHNGASTAVNSLVAGDFITVTVSGNYEFMNLPMLHMPTVTLTTSCTMICEGAS